MQKRQEWISVPEASEVLGCTDVWIIKMIQRGELEGFKLSRRAWAVKRSSVDANLKQYLARDPSSSGRKRSKIG